MACLFIATHSPLHPQPLRVPLNLLRTTCGVAGTAPWESSFKGLPYVRCPLGGHKSRLIKYKKYPSQEGQLHWTARPSTRPPTRLINAACVQGRKKSPNYRPQRSFIMTGFCPRPSVVVLGTYLKFAIREKLSCCYSPPAPPTVRSSPFLSRQVHFIEFPTKSSRSSNLFAIFLPFQMMPIRTLLPPPPPPPQFSRRGRGPLGCCWC